MKAKKSFPSELLLYLMASVMACGIGLSIVFTTDQRWLDWHLSKLGEGGQLAAIVFNTGAVLSGLVMAAFAHKLVGDIRALKVAKPIKNRAEVLLQTGFRVIAVCMMGIGLFPFDRFPVIHNFFGYGTTLMFASLVILVPLVLPVVTLRFQQVTYAFVACLAIMFAVYFASNSAVLRLLYIELIALACFYAWAIILTRTIRQKSVVLTARLQTATE